VDNNVPFGSHRVISIDSITTIMGDEIKVYFSYLPRLADLIGKSGSYV